MLQYQAPQPKRNQRREGTAETEAPRADKQSRLGNSALTERTVGKTSSQGVGNDELSDWVSGGGTEKAMVKGVSRPDKLSTGMKGALIGASEVELRTGEDGTGSVVAKVPEGTAAELVKTKGNFLKVRARSGDKNVEGWVAKELFSDQPAISKDEGNSSLRDNYVYSKFDGDQSPKDPTGKQATQGSLGNCYLIGSLAAVANASPQIIKDMVKYNADKGTYTVRFYEEKSYGKSTPVYIEVDSYLPTSSTDRSDPSYGGDAGGPLWSAIVEKAYAKWKGGYDAIGDGGVGSETMEEITGGRSASKDPGSMKPADVLPYFTAAKKAGKAIYAGSKDGRKSEAQTPFSGSASGSYSATLSHTHKWNEIIPGSLRITDTGGKAGTARDTGVEGAQKANIVGTSVDKGSIDYKANRAELKFKNGIAPAQAKDLEVYFQYHGVIDLQAFVIANHAYAFEGVVEGDKLQFYNPWGSYQPKPMTAEQFLANYDSLSVNTPPANKSAGK